MVRFDIRFVWRGQTYRVRVVAPTLRAAARWLDECYPESTRAEFERVEET